MNNETIKLDDFLRDVINSYGFVTDVLTPETYSSYNCTECNKSYVEEIKFCSEDGAKIIENTHQSRNSGLDEFIRDTIYDLSEHGSKPPKDFPYEFVDSIEKRGDGDGYWAHYIFKRISDNKYFYYQIYDGQIEEYQLEETKKIVVESWDFESNFD